MRLYCRSCDRQILHDDEENFLHRESVFLVKVDMRDTGPGLVSHGRFDYATLTSRRPRA